MVYLESPGTDAAFNLALEQYAFDCLPRDREYLMLWRNANAVIVGRHQNTAREVDAAAVRAKGAQVVRRLSGGGAVYHDLGNLNYTFITDDDGRGLDLRSFCQTVAAALKDLGVAAEVSGRNDLTVDGKKISGNAQYRREGRVMHHGTLLFDTDLSALSSLLRPPADKLAGRAVASVRSRVCNLRPYLGEGITLRDFWDALLRALTGDGGLSRYTLTSEDLARVEAIKRTRYDTWAWNYGASPGGACKARRVEGCGRLEVYTEVRRGVIASFETRGDYFGAEDAAPVAQALKGCKAIRPALLAALSALDMGRYYKGLTAETLADILLE